MRQILFALAMLLLMGCVAGCVVQFNNTTPDPNAGASSDDPTVEWVNTSEPSEDIPIFPSTATVKVSEVMVLSAPGARLVEDGRRIEFVLGSDLNVENLTNHGMRLRVIRKGSGKTQAMITIPARRWIVLESDPQQAKCCWAVIEVPPKPAPPPKIKATEKGKGGTEQPKTLPTVLKYP